MARIIDISSVCPLCGEAQCDCQRFMGGLEYELVSRLAAEAGYRVIAYREPTNMDIWVSHQGGKIQVRDRRLVLCHPKTEPYTPGVFGNRYILRKI